MSKTLIKYYGHGKNEADILIGGLVEWQGSAEFVWNIHPFDWFMAEAKPIIDEYGNHLTTGDFRDILLKTRSWNLASIGKLGPIRG